MQTLTRKLVERMGGRVDRAAGVIYGVKLLGRKSRNGREYTERAMRDGAALYEGKKIFVDHPEKDRLNQDRKFGDWAGVIRSPRFEGGAIRGDIHLRRASKHFEELIEAAESFSGCFGMSHVADGESRMVGGTEVIESIREVYSVDIVTNPASAAGLFENVGGLDDGEVEVDLSGRKHVGATDGSWADVWDVISDAENTLATAHEKLGGGYDAKPTRDLLDKHGKALAGLVGQSVIDELTALSAKEFPEPVSESFRRAAGIPRERSPEDLQRFANLLR